MAWLEAGRHTLRITVQESENTIEITLEGRVAGPWVTELSKVWVETAPKLGKRILQLDLRNVIYAEAAGKKVLRDIYAQTSAKLITSTPWTLYLAEEIMHSEANAC